MLIKIHYSHSLVCLAQLNRSRSASSSREGTSDSLAIHFPSSFAASLQDKRESASIRRKTTACITCNQSI